MFTTQQLAAILDALPDTAFLLTQSGRYAAVFGGKDLRYHEAGNGLAGKTMHEVLSREKADWFARQIAQAVKHKGLHIVEYSMSPEEVSVLDDAGPESALWFEARIQALDFALEGEPLVLWVASNITERKRYAERLRELSEVDMLSNVCNRRKLMSCLNAQFEAFCRYHTPTALLLFDIDDFKQVNDTLGHHAGDAVIVAMGKACRDHIRASDLAARFGGDEFVVVMPHTTKAEAMPLAERLRDEVSLALRRLQFGELGPTVSAGLSEFLPDDKGCEDALRRADQAMYRAKQGGRNRLVPATG